MASSIWDALAVASDEDRPAVAEPALSQVENKAVADSTASTSQTENDGTQMNLEPRTSVTSTDSDLFSQSAQDELSLESFEGGSQIDADCLSMICDSITIESIAMKTLSIVGEMEETPYEDAEVKVVHEGSYTKIICVRDQANKFGSRTGFVAVKSLNDEFPDQGQISRLGNEYAISRQLTRCNAIRAALLQTELNEVHSLFLEWAPGVTLKEWIKSTHKKERPTSLGVNGRSSLICENDMKIILQVACSISRGLSEIHDAGVAHGNIDSRNIIVDHQRSNESISVKIIGLGSASLLTDTEESSPTIRKDLLCLGSMLLEMFTGGCPSNNINDHESFFDDEENESKTLMGQNQIISLLSARVPLVLAKLTLDMMEAKGSSPRFQSARDVDRELYTVMANLGSIMSKSDQQPNIGRLQLPRGMLYGRDFQLKTLMDACSKIGKSDGSKIVLVSGYSGAGKSTLVKHVERPLKEKGVHFISGKFDQLQQAKPLSAINAALAQYCNDIVQQGQSKIQQVREAITEAINTDIGVLTEAFPCLCKIIIKPTSAPTEVQSMAAQNRFKFIFQMFVRAIATSTHPLVLFLDDLHWADELSLRLISTLVTDVENKNFLFIGSYRENETCASDPLAVQLHELEKKSVHITNISVSTISKEDVNKLISDTIGMPQRLTKSLADIVYQKTSGNALLVTQFLQSLWDEDLLLFSLDSNTWGWDSKAIEAKEIPDNAGVLLSGKILQLPRGCQYAMKLLACMGSRCDESTLRLIIVKGKGLGSEINGTKRQMNVAEENHQFLMLDFAIDEGLLKKEGSDYVFVHDQIQQAAYSLIPENERGLLHQKIGHLILENTLEHEIDDVLFIVVNQLNQGRMHLRNEEQKVELQRLNLKAGEKAMTLAAFAIASSYLKTGIDLFCDDHWNTYYDLSLQLYSLYTEAQYSMCIFQEVGHVSTVVIKNAKSFEDKLRVYATLIKALGVQNKFNEAIEVNFSVLSQLGVDCMSQGLDRSVVMRDWMKMKKSLEEMTDAEFLNYKELTDSNMLVAMKFLYLLILYAYMSKQELFPTIIIQMMQLTLQHGVCKESCVALGSCSYLLCEFKDFKGAKRVGFLSLGLLEKLKAQEYFSQVYICVYGCIHSWLNHIKLSLVPLMSGYQAGMQTGDIQHAMLNINQYLRKFFMCGQNLKEVKKKIDIYVKQMIEYKQTTVYELILPTKQAVSDLSASADDSLSGLTKNKEEESILEQAIEKNKLVLVTEIYIFGSVVAYIFGDYELASALVQKRHDLEKQMSRTSILFGMTAFYDGLIFLAMAHKSSEFEWSSEVSNVMSKMESFVQIGKANCEHKLLLLEAETKSRMGEKEVAAEKYDLAIAVAEKNEYIHEQAIACERAADFFLRNKDPKTASQYYGKAHDLYLQWGAQSKADHLIRTIPF